MGRLTWREPFSMDNDLSPQDKKDLDKFIKFFALKTVQVIVQARLGEKICSSSSSSPTGSDWFNLAIKDIPEVTHEAKKALAGQLPGIGRSMCVEISLKTSEGDSMELETWCLEMNEKCDKDIKVSYTVYNRLSLLLKSLLAITRVTPAYKLSRKQGHDYVILYRIYFGEVQLAGLGEGFQTVRVGLVGTPTGTITLSCAYRTNLAFMSTRQFERTGPIMGIIIDHFVERPFPNTGHMHACDYRATGEEDGVGYPGVEDSQEVCTTSFSTSPPTQCVFTVSKAHFKSPKPAVMDTLKVPMLGLSFSHQMVLPGKEGGVPLMPPQPCHGTQAEHGRVSSCPPADPGHHLSGSPSTGEDAETLSRSGEAKTACRPEALETTFTRKVGAFVNKPSTQVTTTGLDLPFAAFAPRALNSEENDPMVHPPESPTTASPLHGSLHSQDSVDSAGQTQDDFVMVDFKPAFSKDDLLPMDLGTFYREFQNPPQLSSLSIDVSAQSMAEDLDSLPEKLAIYEKNIDEFDAFVDTLQ
ncbi:autophagy-related protein 13-like isoform X3 [Scleropages formosus]|uniref:autophagy-related protein 13-like isoform X3 n=1 Tax=Scleropages formosus TaxID=113540 RepID=UPI0010FAA19C|nr:autophagy-related protein 13-like isoform X3 [Scleropages formosus]